MNSSSSYTNGKYLAIKFGAEQLVKRLQQEGRLLIEVKLLGGACELIFMHFTVQVRDDTGNLLGGKKAAMQFVHERVYGKDKLVNLSLDLKEGSREDDGESEKKNDFDELWKLSEKLKTLEAALESLQGKEITLENAKTVQVEKAGKGGNEKDKEKDIDETRSGRGVDETETANEALGDEENDVGDKLEVEQNSSSRSTAVDERKSGVRLTEKGLKGRRKALAGFRGET